MFEFGKAYYVITGAGLARTMRPMTPVEQTGPYLDEEQAHKKLRELQDAEHERMPQYGDYFWMASVNCIRLVGADQYLIAPEDVVLVTRDQFLDTRSCETCANDGRQSDNGSPCDPCLDHDHSLITQGEPRTFLMWLPRPKERKPHADSPHH